MTPESVSMQGRCNGGQRRLHGTVSMHGRCNGGWR
jgi:hypothetical protein